MKKIKYIIPYFGKLPKTFEFWLLSCKHNPSINWLIFTDDKTEYNYPDNVEVVYCNFEFVKNKIQNIFDFDIELSVPRKLCDYKVVYGEAFQEYLDGFDFWGYCDLDMVFGNIRDYFTDELLDKYSKIGFQGHSTIFKNDMNINSVYKCEFDDLPSYKTVFNSPDGFCFDEPIITEIFKRKNIPSYLETNFIHFSKYDIGLYCEHLPKSEDYKNDNQIFVWDNGKLIRYYLKNKEVLKEEYMYMHFFCRPLVFKTNKFDDNKKYIFYSDIIDELDNDIDYKFIKKHSRKNAIRYYIRSFWNNRKKITIKRILFNIKTMIRYKKGKKK